MKRTTHTLSWLVTSFAVLLGMALGPAAAWAEDRSTPGIATLGETTGLPAYGVNQGLGATAAGALSIGDAHQDLRLRPGQVYSLAAQSPSVVNLPRYETAAPRPAPEPQAVPAAETPTAQSGFDWLAAAVGIAIGFGAAVLVGLALLTSRRRRSTLQGT